LDELAKGYFPHLFNKKENEHYVGPLRPSPYYNPNGTSPDEKEKFLEWHNELKQNNYVFNFQQEILSYCRSDVDILRRCCLEFRELFRDVTDIDPFEKCLTIASACNLVYRTNFLQEDTIAIIPLHGCHPKVKQSNIALKWNKERAIQGTWCSVELDKALEKGYRILQLHEVWHFPETSDKRFKDYIDTFLKIKQEASGYPKDCVTEEQKQQYVDGYLEVEGIRLDPSKIEYNPGMCALAKLMLNSFWGKFAQRSNMAKTEQIRDPQVYYDDLTSDEINVLDANLVSDDTIEIQYEYTENFIAPNESN
jgi:hypothetical protein